MHRKTREIPFGEIVTLAILVGLFISLVVGISALGSPAAAASAAPAWQAQSAANLAKAAQHTCPAIGVHKCITAPHNHAHMVVPDNGIQPLCPHYERGWTVTFRLRGTHDRFNARCDAAGSHVSVWDAIVKH